MAYDDEELFAAPWKQEYGRRVFRRDAFLSYRHTDANAVEKLAALMRGYGAEVWWDEQDDLVDRRLVEKIGHAIFHSRYIVACVSSASALSEWMSAEFSKALERSKGNCTRVPVALVDPNAPVPELLAGCHPGPRFRSRAVLAEQADKEGWPAARWCRGVLMIVALMHRQRAGRAPGLAGSTQP